MAECPSAVQVVVVAEKYQPTQRIQEVNNPYPPDKLEIEIAFDGLEYFFCGHHNDFFIRFLETQYANVSMELQRLLFPFLPLLPFLVQYLPLVYPGQR